MVAWYLPFPLGLERTQHISPGESAHPNSAGIKPSQCFPWSKAVSRQAAWQIF